MGSKYVAYLDSIADKLESVGQLRLAKAVDRVSDRLEKLAFFSKYLSDRDLITHLESIKRKDPGFKEEVIQELRKRLNKPENSDILRTLYSIYSGYGLKNQVNDIDALILLIREDYEEPDVHYIQYMNRIHNASRGGRAPELEEFFDKLDSDKIGAFSKELKEKYPDGWYNKTTRELVIKGEDIPDAPPSQDFYRPERTVVWGEHNKPYLVHYYHNGGVDYIEDATKEDIAKNAAFDEKRISGWSKVQDSIMRAIEEVNRMHIRSGPEEKKAVDSVYDFLQQAQDACNRQFKS